MAVTVRCTRDALFETSWTPLLAAKAIKPGSKRILRCPVHHRWEIIRPVDPDTLTAAERAQAAKHPARPIP